jgi:hypothetical protein
MVSLYIPANAKLVAGATSAADAYIRLRNSGYLSIRALMHRDRVEALIQDTWESYPKVVAPGRESSRDVIEALRHAGYLSILGQTWGGRAQSRGSETSLRTLKSENK